MSIPPETRTTILLLVSDAVVRAVMQEILEHEGYVVLAVGELGQAVDRLKDIAPELLITRTYVRDLPGHEAAKYLRTKCNKMKVLLVGGLLADDRLEYRTQLEHFEVFPKPYPASEFVHKVREVLSKPRG
jgi:CheY-like chemotaxis protein